MLAVNEEDENKPFKIEQQQRVMTMNSSRLVLSRNLNIKSGMEGSL